METRQKTEMLTEEAFAELIQGAKEPGQIYDVDGNPVQLRHLRRNDTDRPVGQPLDVSRVQTFKERSETGSSIEPLPRQGLDPENAPRDARVPRRQRSHDIADKDKKPLSRWVKRGVQYPNPGKAYFSMLWVLISRLLLLAVVIGTPICVILAAQSGDNAIIWKFLPVLGAFVVFGIGHLAIAARLRCKICSCPILFSRRCHKNSKAHPKFPLGHVGSTALHGIIFRWFRCMYCGTAVQLGGNRKE